MASLKRTVLDHVLADKKFQSIKHFFDDLEDSDAASWTQSFLFSLLHPSAEPNQKLVMRAFAVNPGIEKLMKKKQQSQEEIIEEKSQHIADFSCLQLVPEKLQARYPEALTMQEVRRNLLTRGVPFSKIKINNCSLFPEDIQMFSRVVADVAHENLLAEGVILDLSGNRFDNTGNVSEEALRAMLKVAQVGYVVVSHTPFASVDNTRFFAEVYFSTIDVPWIAKLIWIPSPWLAAKGWCKQLPGTATEEQLIEIEQIHLNFYKITSPL